MPSQYPYRITIQNEYLGASRVVRAMSRGDLEFQVTSQLYKWNEQEQRKRTQKQKEAQRESARQHAVNLKLQAEEDTALAQQQLAAFREILSSANGRNLAIDWEQLLDRQTLESFQFNYAKPERDKIRVQLLGPTPVEIAVAAPAPEKPSVWEFLLPFLRTRRLEREAEATAAYEKQARRARVEHAKRVQQYKAREHEVTDAYNVAVREYNSKLKTAQQAYVKRRNEFRTRQEEHNNSVIAFRDRYAAGEPDGVEQYVQMVLARSTYPEDIAGEPEVLFDSASKTLIVNFWLPAPSEVPRVTEYQFVASRKEIKPKEMKAKDFEAFYDNIIQQLALRTIHEILISDAAQRIEAVVFNGWARGIDSKTGKAFTSCILSCQAPREQFVEFDLLHVEPKECVRGLKGITAGPLAMLAPVRPIMDINRDDDRFVESKEVLDQMRPQENLAAMEWEDFEHLVRELFEKEFQKSGGEVRITQASRDRGVDAIAFDPDPIRGGKFVIQAKRYNIVVPVSAVRDLFGTMTAEGANKGILVTTSHFGRDSLEFAKDKPITLINGENLLHMFQQHGYNLHISLLPKGDPRRGLG
jgi:restriction system protein